MSRDNFEISPICPSEVKISHTFSPLFFTVIDFRLSRFDSTVPINNYARDKLLAYILYESLNATFSNGIKRKYVAFTSFEKL